MKTPLLPVSILAAAILASGCERRAAFSEVKAARETSFDEVTQQLDQGGTFYCYLATDQWFAGMHTNVAQWSSFAAMLPGVDASDREEIQRTFGSLARMVETSGIESLTGVGMSAIQISPELHRTKLVLHHRKGAGEGFLWDALGGKPHLLEALEWLPEETAVAAFGDIDLTKLWGALESEAQQSGSAPMAETLAGWPGMFEQYTGIPWPEFLKSLGGEAGLVLTLNEASQVPVPFTEGTHVPEPGLLLAVKVNDDLLYNRISAKMKDSGMARITDEKSLKMSAIRLPIPVPLDLELTVASSGDRLFVASASALVRGALDVKSGKTDGLRKRGDVAELLKYLPAEGNQFFYLDRRLSATLQSVQKSWMSRTNSDPAQSALLEKLVWTHKPAFGMAVGRRTATGWESVCVGSQNSSTAFVAAPAVGGAAMISAMVIPAVAKARDAARSRDEENQSRD